MDSKLAFALIAVPVCAAGIASLRVSTDTGPPAAPPERPSAASLGPLGATAPSPSPRAPRQVARTVASAPDAAGRPPGTATDDAYIGDRVATYDRALAAEARDPSWSASAESRARSHLDGRDDVEPIDVWCGATFCRIAFAVLDPDVAPGDITRAATPWAAPAFVTMNLEGERVATLFLAREGYVLPER